MKSFLFFSALFMLFACSEEGKPKKSNKIAKPEVLFELKDGMFTEWYPGKKQIKFKGGKDKKGNRHGVWTFYSEGGNELSITVYEHGLREGFTVVKYPNGAIHYRGEYKNDKVVGLWTTYNEKGEFISETDFGYPKD